VSAFVDVAIPAELRERSQWVVWRFEERDGKPTKVPYSVDGRLASTTDPATWTTFESVVAADGFDGIGFVFTEDDPYCGVDLDRCSDPLAGLDPDAAELVAALDSYTEESPSGYGVHVIVRARLDGGRRRAAGIEMYDRGRYFTVTGWRINGTPATIEERQTELDELRARLMPEPVPSASRSPEPVELDDVDLLERAFAARNGADFQRLYEGDWSGYPSQSEADLAFCRVAAFWTGCDPARIDSWLRSSGLMRDKWERADYRERTIAAAIDGTTEVYEPRPPGASQVRPAGDAPTGFDPDDDGVGAGASLRPSIRRDAGRDAPTTGTGQTMPEPQLHVIEASSFSSVDEASAEPLLGDRDGTVLAAGGTLAFYGDGGAGKTTLELDQAFHLSAGVDWLGLSVPHPCVVLLIENEGPRGKFREKLRAKFAAWDGPPLDRRLHVLERPWSLFTFRNDQHRAELVEVVRELEVDVLIAGPGSRLGLQGGGTPEEIKTFVNLLELVRAELDRPLAFELVLHENKAGEVSGAWEGATDTLVHVQPRGNGQTAIVWRKARWHSSLHGKAWKLKWLDGERFELDDTPDTTDEAIADQLLALVRESPGGSWNDYDPLLKGKARTKRRVRDELLADGRLVNAGTPKAMKLYLPGQVGDPEQSSFDDEEWVDS
jgi:hypothetical protein